MVKYYLYIVNNKKAIELASSTGKSELRDKALERIGEKIKNYNGLYLYRVKVSKVTKADIKNDEQNKIKLIGGPWVASVERILINVSGDKVTLKGLGEESIKIYAKTEPTNESVNKLIWDYSNDKFNMSPFAVNVIN